jgi:hypothetical protein
VPAESLVALALDDLEENRPDHVIREDLQQDAALRAAGSSLRCFRTAQ